MKNILRLPIILFLLTAFHACGDLPLPPAFWAADTLINNHPDSALTLLKKQEKEMANAPESTRMYYHLLTIKAQDKAYIPHTSDSLIREIVRYYEDKGDKRYLPEAYFYAGSVYRDLGDAPQALDYFYKVAQSPELEFHYDLGRRAYNQIGELFLYQSVYDKALPWFRKAYQCCVLGKDDVNAAYSLRNIGRTYSTLQQTDSALYYYRKADTLACRLKDDKLRRGINGELSAYYTGLGMHQEAYESLRLALSHIDIATTAARYCSAARYYFSVHQLDSAGYYYQRLTEIDQYSYKEEGHHGLGQIARLRGDYKQAFEHFDQFLLYADSTQQTTQTEAVRRINALYNYQLREKENARLQAENKRQQTQISIALFTIIAMAALFLAYHQRKKRKEAVKLAQLRKLREMQEQKYRQSQAYLLENQKLISQLERKLQEARQSEDRQQQSLLSAQKLSLEKDNEQIEARTRMEEEAVKALKASAVYRRFHQADENHPLNAEAWEELEEAVNRTYGDFTHRLEELHPLTEVERHVCLLIKIEIPLGQIAWMVHRSKQGISSIRKRLFQKAFKREGTPDGWDHFVRNF